MKKISMILFLILTGCAASSSSYYYYNKIDKDGNLYGKEYYFGTLPPKGVNANQNYEKISKKKFNKFGNESKEYCIYGLLYIPINFWDITNSDSKDIQKVIKDLNKDGKNGNAMKDIIYLQRSSLFFPFSSYCSIITAGTLVTEE